MENKVIFTIVAKNYLASAITLGKSVKKYCQSCDFIIYLSDGFCDDTISKTIEFPIYQAEDFDITNFEQQAFMYDVVELSTAIKPYFMLYLMNEMHYSKVVYLDPDTWVMDSLDNIFDLLDEYEFVLTPHIVEESMEPNIKETHILDRGVFNLGFLAAQNADNSKKFLLWWQKRLESYCFRDDRLFVDQKWVAFLPEFCDKFYVLLDKAYNVADWNYHERELEEIDGVYYVINNGVKDRIKFFHFSGIKDQTPDSFFKRLEITPSKEQKIVLSKLILVYEEQLKQNGFDIFSKLPYKYGKYSNGESITLLHRRIYRKYKTQINNPFEAKDNSFYAILKKEKLLNETVKSKIKVTNKYKLISQSDRKVGQTFAGKMFVLLMKTLIRVVGIEKYLLLLNQFHIATDLDEQNFLITK